MVFYTIEALLLAWPVPSVHAGWAREKCLKEVDSAETAHTMGGMKNSVTELPLTATVEWFIQRLES